MTGVQTCALPICLERLNAGKLLDRVMLAIRDGEAPDVGKWMRELNLHEAFATGQRILHEQTALDRSYEMVRAELAAGKFGDPFEVLVELAPDSESIKVMRGPALRNKEGRIVAAGKEVKEATGSRVGFGLTKPLVKHPDVNKEDVLNIPYIMREYEPEPATGPHSGRTWIVERSDGRQVVIGESIWDGERMLATVHLADEDKPRSLSIKKDLVESSRRLFSPPEDTHGEIGRAHV